MEQYPKRKGLRLKEYDYSSKGAYFLTFCVKNRMCLLSELVGRDALGAPFSLALTEAGKAVERHLLHSEIAYPGLVIDNYVIMPNHVHILLSWMPEKEEGGFGAPRASRPTDLVPRMVAAIKRFSNRDAGASLWQTSYYDHIIRDENDFLAHWKYIEENPIKWTEDPYYTV